MPDAMLWRWTLKGLWQYRTGLAGSVLGVAGALFLVMFFQAVFRGESEQIVAYPRHAEADVWVMQQGVSNMHMASSFIWDWKQDRIAQLSGVERVTPILYLNTVARTGGRHWFSYVVGIKENGAVAGPWAMSAGRGVPRRGEAVVPETLARLAGIGIGDEVRIAGLSLRVSGLSAQTFSMANSLIFVAFEDLEDMLNATGLVSYLLIKAQAGSDPAQLAGRIEQDVEKVTALTREAFINSDFDMAMQMGVEIIGLMSVIASALGVVIVGFSAYSHGMRQRRELAVAKALGMVNRDIYLNVLIQTAVISMMGLLLAVVLALILMPLLSAAVPQVSLRVTVYDLMQIAAPTAVISVLAALMPARAVARTDPLTAFKG